MHHRDLPVEWLWIALGFGARPGLQKCTQASTRAPSGVGKDINPSSEPPIDAVVSASLQALEDLADAASAMSEHERTTKVWVERVFSKPAVFQLHNLVSTAEADRMIRCALVPKRNAGQPARTARCGSACKSTVSTVASTDAAGAAKELS